MKKQLSTSTMILGGIALAALALVMWGVGVYNGLIELRTVNDNAWANVETQYQRRADLIPQLIATVQGAADFEESVLTEVTEARTAWQDTASDASATIDDQMAASSAFDSALSRLLVTVESYPALTATEGFITMQSQLEGTENRIAVSRKDYNDTIQPYNAKVQKVPEVFIANFFGFDQYPYFESDEGSENAPTVEFDFGSDEE
ncbi:MAG: LemA family protein [bacterium]|jgi:LemA protein|nr:LemA family protein [bacterium]